MAKPGEGTVGRRKFLSGAAAGAAAVVGQGQVADAQQPSTEHEHQTTVPSDIALRVKALETVLVDPRISMPD